MSQEVLGGDEDGQKFGCYNLAHLGVNNCKESDYYKMP